MKVFLTGASGFIGKTVRRTLEAQKHTVVPHIHSEHGEFSELPSGIDLVVNCAGRLGGQNFSEKQLFEANVLLPVSLAQSCRKKGIALVHLSTPGVTGLTADAREDDEFNPMGMYEKTKVEAEKKLRSICPDVTILRPDFVFGPGDMHKFPLFHQVKRGWFPLVGSGSSKTRPTDVRDVADAVVCSFPGGILNGGLYNIGGPQVISVRDLARRIAVAMDKKLRLIPIPRLAFRIALALGPLRPKSLSRSRYNLFGTDRFCNTDKAQSTGFLPKFTFASTAADTVRWYRERGLL